MKKKPRYGRDGDAVDYGSGERETGVNRQGATIADSLRYTDERRLLNTSVAVLQLSVRSSNCLRKQRIRTIGELTRWSEIELSAIRNLGSASMTEIKRRLEDCGLHLRASGPNQLSRQTEAYHHSKNERAVECDDNGNDEREDKCEDVRVAKGYAQRSEIWKQNVRLLDAPVDELALSVRSSNCLRVENIRTIGDLTRKTEYEIAMIRNLGRKSLDEIKCRLKDRGLYLGSTGGESNEVQDGARRMLLDTPIAGMGLSVRSSNCLRVGNIRTIGDLTRRTEYEIATIRNLGRKSLDEITRRLDEMGLALAEEDDDKSFDRLIRIESASTLKEELVNAVVSVLSSKGPRLACFLAYYGVKGGAAKTLQTIADSAPSYGFERAVTRERVRQVIGGAERQLRRESDRVEFTQWESSIAVATNKLPRAVRSFLSAFGYGRSERPDHTFRMLEVCSDVFGLDFPFEMRSVKGVGPLVVDGDSESVFKAIAALPEAAVGPYICSADVSHKLSIDEQTLARIIDESIRWEFLDPERRYFWAPPALPPTDFGKTGNGVLTALCKVFSVASNAMVSDLALSMARDRGVRKIMVGTPPIPEEVVESIAERSGLFDVQQGEISRKEGPRWCCIGRRDMELLAISVECGRVVSSGILYSKLLDKGLSREGANQVITYSPFLVHTLSGGWKQEGIYKFVPKPEEIDLCQLSEQVGNGSLERDIEDIEDIESSESFVTIPISPRSSLSGRYYGLDVSGINGTWKVCDSNLNVIGEVAIKDRGVSGLRSVIVALGMKNGDVLRLRIDRDARALVVVS